MDNEIWSYIPGYVGYYQVSTFGNVAKVIKKMTYPNGTIKCIEKEKITPFIQNGYYSVYLTNPETKINKIVSVHRLVALTFIAGHEEGLVVNHKDENKLNNYYKNLEWCTCSYNIKYSTDNERRARNSDIVQKLRSINKLKNTNTFNVLYLYFKYISSNNSATLIISTSIIKDKKDYFYDSFHNCRLDDKKVKQKISYILYSCFINLIRIKIVFNEIE